MMVRPLRAAVVAAFALATLMPLSTVMAQSPAASGGTGPALEGTTWQVTAVAGVADPGAVPGMQADLVLAAGTASGFGGCNAFTTRYVLDGDSLTFQTPASTMMACEEPTMAFESVYLGALPQTATYTISDDTLELLDETGSSVVTLVGGTGPGASGAPTSVVGAWTVTQLDNGNQGVEAVPAEPVLTVTFLADGTVQGFGGCNGFGGPYVVGGETIGIGPLNATMMACGDPADTLEAQLIQALEASTAWSLRGDQLELRDDSGGLQVGLVAGASAPAAS
jgi:heat shock protein HslJ